MARTTKPDQDAAVSTDDVAPVPAEHREHDHDAKERERNRRPKHMSEGTRQEILQHGEAFDPSKGRIVTRDELEGTTD